MKNVFKAVGINVRDNHGSGEAAGGRWEQGASPTAAGNVLNKITFSRNLFLNLSTKYALKIENDRKDQDKFLF